MIIDQNVTKEVQEIEKLINGKGRILFRQSGTESVIRIMVECESMQNCVAYANKIAEKIKSGGHILE